MTTQLTPAPTSTVSGEAADYFKRLYAVTIELGMLYKEVEKHIDAPINVRGLLQSAKTAVEVACNLCLVTCPVCGEAESALPGQPACDECIAASEYYCGKCKQKCTPHWCVYGGDYESDCCAADIYANRACTTFAEDIEADEADNTDDVPTHDDAREDRS